MFVCCVNINVILQTAPSPIMDTSSINNLLFSASFQVFMTSSSLLFFNAIIIPSRTLLSLSLWQRFVSISKQTIESIFLTRFFFSVRLLQLRAHSWPIYNWFLFFLLSTASSTTEIFSTFNAHSCFQRKKNIIIIVGRSWQEQQQRLEDESTMEPSLRSFLRTITLGKH